jgi:GNAT superfamily N-acetyltransferase
MSLAVREIGSDEGDAVVGVVVRSMRDNPSHVYLFGADPAERARRLELIFRSGWPAMQRRGIVLGAYREGELAGVLAMMPPGRCQPTAIEALTMIPRLLSVLGFGGLVRSGRWFGELAKHHPSVAHWHLGPVAVDSHLQGQGIGSALMTEYCARLDRIHAVGFLEADKPINVPFYEKFGFHICAKTMVAGAPNWFMLRPART